MFYRGIGAYMFITKNKYIIKFGRCRPQTGIHEIKKAEDVVRWNGKKGSGGWGARLRWSLPGTDRGGLQPSETLKPGFRRPPEPIK